MAFTPDKPPPPPPAHLSLPPPFATTTHPPTLLTPGAEALLYHTTFTSPAIPAALKYRPSKPYRHPTLDKRLTKHRILSEARTLVRCRREGVSVPGVLALDAEGAEGWGRGGWILLEWVWGGSVRDVLVQVGKFGKGRGEEGEEGTGLKGLMGKIGRAVGKMHAVGVIHGDLTTSNMILRPRRKKEKKEEEGKWDVVNGNLKGVESGHDVRDELEGDIVLIDFGLSDQSIKDEDRAVDLYVLERAFGSTHPEAEEDFHEVLRVYGEAYKGAKVVLKRLDEVRMRGRKKSMIG